MAYTLYCRECDWEVDEVELKGEANWIAGRHISETGHSVALRRIEDVEADAGNPDFVRAPGGRALTEIYRAATGTGIAGDAPAGSPRQCGPVMCFVETIAPAGRPASDGRA